MKTLKIGLLALMLSGGFAVAAVAAEHYPYATTIRCGEILTAELTLGVGATACTPGNDAIPAFVDIASYEAYYVVDGSDECGEGDREKQMACLRPTYRSMKRSGRMHPLITGERVTVLSEEQDPDDKRYTVCKVRTASQGTWYVLCDALAE